MSIANNFTFDQNISAKDRSRLRDCHLMAFSAINQCGNLSMQEKADLRSAYSREIHHSRLVGGQDFASSAVGGSFIRINIDRLFPFGDLEIMQTLIHEMMHCAGYSHPNKTVSDQPKDGGPYFGSPPLRSELCIAGVQSDTDGPQGPQDYSRDIECSCSPRKDGTFGLRLNLALGSSKKLKSLSGVNLKTIASNSRSK